MSSKSGTVVPGFTRTCAPLPKRAGVRVFFSFLFFLATAAPPVALLVILWKNRPPGQAPAGILSVAGTLRQANAIGATEKVGRHDSAPPASARNASRGLP